MIQGEDPGDLDKESLLFYDRTFACLQCGKPLTNHREKYCSKECALAEKKRKSSEIRIGD